MALSQIFSMMQMQNNAMTSGFCGISPLYMGASAFLGGSMMSGCGMMMMSQIMNAVMMQQMMQAAMQYQSQPLYMPPSGYARPPLFNPQTGLPGCAYPATNGQTYSANPGFGPRTNDITDRGASAADPAYAGLRRFANQNGSLDGTFITPTSSLEQDQRHLNQLEHCVLRQNDATMAELKNQNPQQLASLRSMQEGLDRQFDDFQKRGIQIAPEQKMLMESEQVDKLWKEGKVSDGMGKQNAKLREMLNMQNRADANEFLKFGMRAPSSLARNYTWESPFNPNRRPGAEIDTTSSTLVVDTRPASRAMTAPN